MPFELGLLLALILLNGFFALSEMAIVTARKSRLKHKAEKNAYARAALALAEHPENFLSAVQIGITLVSILTGVFSGAAIGERIAGWLMRFEMLTPYAEEVGLGIAVVCITFVSIILGELIPKRLALLAPERIATIVGVPMTIFAKVTHPAVVTLSVITRLALKLVGARSGDDGKVTEEEIRMLVAESAEQGEIEDVERTLINRALRLTDRTAESLMTPRNRIAWLDAEATLAENLAVMRTTPFAAYPVMRGSDKEVLGILDVKTLIDKIGASGQFDLFKRVTKSLFVPLSTKAMTLLETFRDSDSRIALVVDEYGDIMGLITRNDVLSAAIGASVHGQGSDESEDALIVQRADGSYLLDGALKIEDLQELLQLSQLPGADEHEYHSLAGMLIAMLGHIPKVSETYDWEGYRFEVVDRDGARVDKVLVTDLGETAAL